MNEKKSKNGVRLVKKKKKNMWEEQRVREIDMGEIERQETDKRKLIRETDERN